MSRITVFRLSSLAGGGPCTHFTSTPGDLSGDTGPCVEAGGWGVHIDFGLSEGPELVVVVVEVFIGRGILFCCTCLDLPSAVGDGLLSGT